MRLPDIEQKARERREREHRERQTDRVVSAVLATSIVMNSECTEDDVMRHYDSFMARFEQRRNDKRSAQAADADDGFYDPALAEQYKSGQSGS